MNRLMKDCCRIRPFFAAASALIAIAGSSVRADVKLATPFGDHMVLQRQMPVPIWGTAGASESITISFAGQSKTVTADAAGNWMSKLEALEASAQPAPLTVKGNNTVTINDVLVGEVWLCSGQSNMEASMERLMTSAAGPELKALAAERYRKEVATATPEIRVFHAGNARGETRRSRWMECGPDALKNENGRPGFSAVAALYARELHAGLKVPIGVFESAVGGTRIETWTPPEAYASFPAFKEDAAKTPMTIDGVSPGKNFHSHILPLAPFAIRGVLWYQGESSLIDSDNGPRYADKMEAMILNWRALWKQPELPFYYVQLPRHLYAKRKPEKLTNESLPFFREGQAMALRIPQTGMVITSDLVDTASEIHPPNKWDIAHRLALLALAKTYGQKDIVFSGPTYRSSEVRDGKMVIHFDHVGHGLVNKQDKPLGAFLIAGADRQFVQAEAAIDGDTVVVSSATVKEPVAVRFCWTELAVPNLFNREGLPAAPFRTDEWPPHKP